MPRSYGFAIILLTVLVKVATYPLTAKQARRSSLPACRLASAAACAGGPCRGQMETFWGLGKPTQQTQSLTVS